MRFPFLIFLVFSGGFFCARPTLAQNDSVQLKSEFVLRAESIPVSDRLWHVKFSPQHLFINGYNLEVEGKLPVAGHHSITFSPRYFKGKTETVDKLSARESESSNSDVTGYGAEMMHRIYHKNPLVKRGQQYFAYGLNYHHFDLNYASLGWAEVESGDGLKYYLYKWHKGNEKVDRFGLVAVSGVQSSFLTERLITDFYGGLGYRFSKSSIPESDRFNANIIDFGSEGLYLTVGFKLGVSF